MRIERLIYSVLVILLTIIASINWRKAALFKADNEELRGRIESLEVEIETNERLAKRAQEKSEKLRAAEFIQISSTNQAIESLTAENISPVASPPNVTTAAQP